VTTAQPQSPTSPGGPGFMQRLVDRATDLLRDPNPILVKELRATFRTKLFIRFLYLSTGLVGVIVLAGGAAVAAGPLPPAEVGQIVFQIFFTTALFVLSLVAPAYAATTLTSEKETRTYESLLLSGMKPWRIVRGKFLAAYSSMFLVLVALAPVVGIAFLFGGVSPWHVLVGFVGLLVVLAPAIAFGVAISARLTSTRIAILLATIVFVPTAFFGTGVLWALGELARDQWGIGMQGPFWFSEALVSRWNELDTLGLLLGLPLYLFAMPVWFLLASAVAGVRPAAEDRSTPFKIWSLVSAFGLVGIVFWVLTLFSDGNDCGEAGVAFVIAGGMALWFYALLFMNEPPLPPRLAEERARRSRIYRLFSLLGPGAAPTLRFNFLLILATSFGLAFAASFARHAAFPGYSNHFRHDAALLVLAIGQAMTAVFMASFGSWLRVVLRNGIAARVLAIAVMFTLSILPFLFALILDPDSLDRLDHDIPFVIWLAPSLPEILGANIAGGEMRPGTAAAVLIPTVIYGLGAALFWVMLEARVVGARKTDRARREQRAERARSSRPSIPLLQRASRPSDPIEGAAVAPASDATAPVPGEARATEPDAGAAPEPGAPEPSDPEAARATVPDSDSAPSGSEDGSAPDSETDRDRDP